MPTVLLDEKGLAPAICQNIETGEVLMLGYVTPGALKRTMEGGEVWFYSRSRSDLWHKGEVSGNYMRIRSASVDCDGDVILLKVVPDGPICHTGEPDLLLHPLRRTSRLRGPRKGARHTGRTLLRHPGTARNQCPRAATPPTLLQAGPERVAQKVIEEAGEAAIAGVKGDGQHLADELADLFYHSLVLMSATGVRPEEVWSALRDRRS